MLFCYLDDSGEEKDPVVTMAGYLSLLSEWEKFELEARAYLDEMKISHLHTVDFKKAHGEFKGWSWEKRKLFAHTLFEILTPHCVLGVEFSVLKEVYKSRRSGIKKKYKNSPFGFCFVGIIDRLVKDEAIEVALRQPGVDLSFVVENGHRNNGDVLAIFNRHKEHPGGHVFNSIAFADKKSCIALQMADFIAYYARRIRVGTSPRREIEIKFFECLNKDIRKLHFFATDFGG